MEKTAPFPAARLAPAAPLALAADELAIFVLNVGDGDAIVVRFPVGAGSEVSAAVIDSFNATKTVDLLADLGANHLRFVCATHPHWDHISGLRRVLSAYAGRIDEFWDSGFRYTSTTYRRLMEDVEALARQRPPLRLIRPTSGYECFHAGVSITVLSPSLRLRNQYDTYGVDVNNASIVLRLNYPVPPPSLQYPRTDEEPPDTPPPWRTAILGGDAQTDAWGVVLAEFPHLAPDGRNWARQIGARTGRMPLLCDFFKVSHHGSKRGINLELLERLGDRGSGGPSTGSAVQVVSSAEQSTYGFPHAITQSIMREVRAPVAQSGATQPADDRLGVYYTAQATDDGSPAGSIGYVVGGNGRTRLYRFGDAARGPLSLGDARLVRN